MAFLRICTAFGVLFASAHAAAVTPIEKVTTLLEDLKSDIEEKGKEEAKTYGKFACFCKESTSTKSDAIKESQDKIDQCNADIEEKTATKKEKEEELIKQKKIVEETTIELQKATEVYEKEKAEYEAKIADLSKAISSAKKAHKVLSESKPSFLDLGATKSVVRDCLDLAEALGVMQTNDQKAVASFMQVDPEDPAYKFHSDKILKIIKDLQTDFEDEKSDVEDKWSKTDEAYQAEKKTLTEKIDTAKEEVETLKGEISDLKEEIAKHKVDLEEAENALTDDSTYLKDLTVRCEDKGKVWDQRTKTRHEEVEAITKALEILKEKAADADETNKRAALLVKEKPVVKQAAAPVEAEDEATPANWKPKVTPAKVEATKPKKTSFLQVASRSQSHKLEDAIDMLRHESARLGSTVLSSVAEHMTKDPFVKIKKLIQALIERLLQESKDEATKKGFCDTELGKSYEDRKNRYAEINKLDADLEDLTATEKKLELEIEELTEDIKKLKEELEKAEEDRKEEKEANLKLIKDADEGAVAVEDALVILKDFYKSAAKNAFVQVAASPIEEDDPGAGFDSKYSGEQDSSKAILGLLEVIKSDYERTSRVTEAEEADAHKKWILFERTSKKDIAAKTEKKALDEQDLDSTKAAIKTGFDDLQTATDLLDKALQNIEDLKPTCIDTGMSYKERVAKREEEIAALKKACKALLPDDGPNDCE